ncbi:MAG: hypothetical protein DCC58_15535, partial [Chloroflexi bacterium]
AALELAGWAVSGKSTILTILDSYEHFQYWFDAGLYLRFDDFIMLFPLAYALGLYWMVERGVTAEEYPTFGALAFLLLFSVTFFHPHYAVWLVPFLALTSAHIPRMVVYHAIQIVCVLVYTLQWGSWTTWDLLKPLLGARTASLPDPVEWVQAQIEPRIFFGFFRSILSATCIWMGWKLIQRLPPRPAATGTSGATRVGAPLLLLGMSPLLFAGCSAVVAGYSSPLAHDYGRVAWPALGATVEQVFIAGPGTSAAIDNDATTTQEQFLARHTALPEDARSGRLDELRVGVRLADDTGVAWATGARLLLLGDDGAVLAEYPIDSLPRTGDWLTVSDPPNPPSGAAVRLQLKPGDGPDAERLEFGLTSDRAPFGGQRAAVLGPDGERQELPGALLVWTRYERDVDLRGVLHTAGASLRGGIERDPAFGLLWLGGLVTLALAGTTQLRRREA